MGARGNRGAVTGRKKRHHVNAALQPDEYARLQAIYLVRCQTANYPSDVSMADVIREAIDLLYREVVGGGRDGAA